jgi:hypothetical protein
MEMPNWKRALIFGSFGASAFFLITGRRSAGIVLATVGAATLASEYPEKIEALWRNAPYYLEKGNQLVSMVARVSEQIARGDWRETIAER